MEKKTTKSYWVKIYLSGDIDVIKQICREYCMKGLCVTIIPTCYIYTGGEEYGVEVGLLNYPRFPKKKKEILKDAFTLAKICRDKAFQNSFLVIDNENTYWDSIHK